MKKIMMISGVILALFVGNAFSSAPASSSGPTLGSFAFRGVNEAKKYNVSFDKNNKFVMRERVVVLNPDPVRNGDILVHGMIVGRNKGSWFVEEKSKISYVFNAENIGKLSQAASNQESASSSSAPKLIHEPAVRREGQFSLRGGLSHGRRNRGRVIGEKEDDASNQAAASSTSSSSSAPVQSQSVVSPGFMREPNEKVKLSMQLRDAAASGDLDKVKTLIRAGADVNWQHPYQGGTSLMYAVRFNRVNSASVIQLLLDAGADINKATKDGDTALMSAAKGDDPGLVQFLLDVGANPNIKGFRGFTALMGATQVCKEKNIHVLLRAGANADDQNDMGNTALFLAATFTDFCENTIQALLDAPVGNKLIRNKSVQEARKEVHAKLLEWTELQQCHGQDSLSDRIVKERTLVINMLDKYIQEHQDQAAPGKSVSSSSSSSVPKIIQQVPGGPAIEQECEEDEEENKEAEGMPSRAVKQIEGLPSVRK